MSQKTGPGPGKLNPNENIMECLTYLMKKVHNYESREAKYKTVLKDKDRKLNELETKLNDTLTAMDGMKSTIKESSKIIEKFKWNDSNMNTMMQYCGNSQENSRTDSMERG